MENTDKIIILIIAFSAAVITWKLLFDFYKGRFHIIFTNIIASIAAVFMFITSITLFAPKNYEKDITPSVQLEFTPVLTIFVMIGILYFLFKYILRKK